ncbi:MAG: TonB-dependent receptor [Edaphobacter sp.]
MTQIRSAVRRTLSIGSLLAVLVSLGFFLEPNASAQVLYGSLTGTITDASKAAVPNAPVTVMDQGTGATRSATTNGQGDYTVGDLQPGTYSIIVSQTGGFSKFTQKNVIVSVNQDTRVDIVLQLASVSAEVTVNSTAPRLQTEDAEVNHNITQSQLAELPITSTQGRNFQALYTLIPGTTNVVEQNSTASNPSRAMSVNVNGIEDMGNTTRIDGAINTYGWLPYLIAYVPPADSIQTVNIATNSFNAEQGEAGGSSINVIIKSGTHDFHGSVWEYNQLFNTNARGYTQTQASFPQVPKNIFNEFGFSIGGPVYIPKILTGKKKLFFFDAFERTTRRQLITGLETVPTPTMLGGDFSAVQTLPTTNGQNQSTILYDPQPFGVGPYLAPAARPTFLSEYGCNCIPQVRQFPGSTKMLALLQPISSTVAAPTASTLNNQLINDYNGNGTLAYNRNTNDAKVNYNPTDRTGVFGRYSIEPFSVSDPQSLGAAGGPTFDGGQAGAAAGRIQNVGLGMNHVISSHMVIDADFGYTRQVTGAQSAIDLSVGDFGLNTLGIPGTNGVGPNYFGQPTFAFCTSNTNNAGGCWTPLGNSQGANPFLFRDNQFTADVNLSWSIRRHSTKYGFTYYHFDLNHFQPTSGSGINSPRGGFQLQGGMTTGPGDLTASGGPNNINAYTALADMLLGLPNSSSGAAIAHPYQLSNPNALRWSQFAVYAQDQWTITPKMTLNYGARYEYYPAPYRDHTGVYRLDPTLPQSANVEIGGVGGNPQNAGIDMGWGQITPRLGIAYRLTEKTVIRTGAGVTTDPDSLRFLRDAFPIDQAPSYSSPSSFQIAVDGSGNPLPFTVGIPNPPVPNLSTGFASLPIGSGTNTTAANYRRGYIESWNFFVQQDLGGNFVMNVGYVGTHQVRQLGGYTLNSGPLPDGTTICMANGHFNPSSPYGTGTCNFTANQAINFGVPCPVGTTAANQGSCYNTGGITMNRPIFSSNYNGLQSQLTRNAGRLAQFGLVYTWSHAFDYADNGAGSGGGGVSFSYPAYFKLNRATAGYDRTNNIQFWSIYHLPFGAGQNYLNHGIASAIFGGFQLNGQISHASGAPFSVSASGSTVTNSPGNTLYADLVAPYRQIGGHAQSATSFVSGGRAWFDPTSFHDPVEPTYTANQAPGTIIAPHFGGTHRNQFRGPGVSVINASVFRGFHIYKETQFQVRVEAFNLFNHAILPTPNNVTVNGGGFGYITSGFGASRSLQFSGRFNF